jgi:hypothetical protein
MKLLLICAMSLAACAAASAQERQTGGHVTPPDPLFERMGKDQSLNSRSVTGTILTIDSARGELTIEGADKAQLTFVVDAKVQLKADKDSAMGGKKDLTLSDYTPGQVVKISYRVADNKALAVRLKRARS